MNPRGNPQYLKRTKGPGRKKGGKNKLTLEAVETEIRHLAMFDPRQLLGQTGRGKSAIFTLRQIAELPDEIAACIASYDVVLGNLDQSDGSLETVVKVRWYNKVDALTLCAKHFKWIENEKRVDMSVDDLAKLLHEARHRHATREP